MFTGLVQALGTIRAVTSQPAGRRLEVGLGGWDHSPALGDSISVNGCCLTVAAVAPPMSGQEAVIAFDVIPQTLAVTTIGRLSVGDRVNLEHAATPTTFLGGHVVLGHVDGLARVVGLETEREWRMRLMLPGDLGRHAVDKGSIALDGVSLTIARVEDAAEGGAARCQGTVIDVCLIPETLARTTLGVRRVDDLLHVEVDYLAKLVERQLAWVAERATQP